MEEVSGDVVHAGYGGSERRCCTCWVWRKDVVMLGHDGDVCTRARQGLCNGGRKQLAPETCKPAGNDRIKDVQQNVAENFQARPGEPEKNNKLGKTLPETKRTRVLFNLPRPSAAVLQQLRTRLWAKWTCAMRGKCFNLDNIMQVQSCTHRSTEQCLQGDISFNGHWAIGLLVSPSDPIHVMSSLSGSQQLYPEHPTLTSKEDLHLQQAHELGVAVWKEIDLRQALQQALRATEWVTH
eukprot:1153081-Pelagomonas_calceolata.AAC.4